MADNLDINNIHKVLPKDFVVFAGTGTCWGTGVEPEWKKLLEALYKKYQVAGVTLDEIEECNYPECAQLIFNEFERRSNTEEYYEIIKKELEANIAPYSTVQLESVCTTGRIVTTNFESSFEKAFEIRFEMENKDKTIQTQILPEINEDILAEDFCITYLHGRIDKKLIVFTISEYEKFYSSKSDLIKFLECVFGQHVIVFIGFSFFDRYLKKTLEKVHTDIEWDREEKGKLISENKERTTKIHYRHYAFLEKRSSTQEELLEEQKLDDDLAAIGIGVVRYNEHSEVINCLKKIREEKRRREPLRLQRSIKVVRKDDKSIL